MAAMFRRGESLAGPSRPGGVAFHARFRYDAANQLLSATVTNAGVLVNQFAYGYDPAGNRLTEQVGASNYTATTTL